MDASILIRYSASNKKSKSNGFKLQKQLVAHAAKKSEGGRPQARLDSVTQVMPARSRLLSISPFCLPGVFHASSLRSIQMPLRGPGFSYHGLELAGADGQPHTVSRQEREPFIRVLRKPRDSPAPASVSCTSLAQRECTPTPTPITWLEVSQ